MNFIDDKEKMKDFISMSKEDFLNSYSYLTEEDYIETRVIKAKYEVEEFLNEDMENQNKIIDYILYSKDKDDMYIVASDGIEEMLEFNPYGINENKNNFFQVPEWDFNFDDYIFSHLQDGYDISFMRDEVHYGIWNGLNDLYPEDINFKKGVQKYLKYCKENNITKQYIDEKVRLGTPDVMKYLDENIKKKKDKGAR